MSQTCARTRGGKGKTVPVDQRPVARPAGAPSEKPLHHQKLPDERTRLRRATPLSPVLKGAGVGGVLLGAESRKPLLVHEGLQRVERGDQHVEAKVELVSVQEQRRGEVPLHYHRLAVRHRPDVVHLSPGREPETERATLAPKTFNGATPRMVTAYEPDSQRSYAKDGHGLRA